MWVHYAHVALFTVHTQPEKGITALFCTVNENVDATARDPRRAARPAVETTGGDTQLCAVLVLANGASTMAAANVIPAGAAVQVPVSESGNGIPRGERLCKVDAVLSHNVGGDLPKVDTVFA